MSGQPTYTDSVRWLNELHNSGRVNPAVDTAEQILRAIDVLSIRQPTMTVTAGSIYLEWSAERDWLRVVACDHRVVYGLCWHSMGADDTQSGIATADQFVRWMVRWHTHWPLLATSSCH